MSVKSTLVNLAKNAKFKGRNLAKDARFTVKTIKRSIKKRLKKGTLEMRRRKISKSKYPSKQKKRAMLEANKALIRRHSRTATAGAAFVGGAYAGRAIDRRNGKKKKSHKR